MNRLFLLIPLLIVSCSRPQSIEWTIDNHPAIQEIKGQPAIKGRDVEFDGIDDGVIFQSVPIAGLEEFTLEAIINPYGDGPFEQRFMHMGSYNSERVMFETRVNPDGTWYFDVFIKLDNAHNKALIDSTLTHKTDSWHAVALTASPKGIASYVDDVLQCSDTLCYKPIIKEGITSIGVRQNFRGWYRGAIRTIRITPGILKPEQMLKAQ